MINWMNKKIKKLDVWDIALTKATVAASVLFIITIWPAAMAWVQSINPWYFLVAFVILVARPFYRFYLK
jgi:hypothetical protein